MARFAIPIWLLTAPLAWAQETTVWFTILGRGEVEAIEIGPEGGLVPYRIYVQTDPPGTPENFGLVSIWITVETDTGLAQARLQSELPPFFDRGQAFGTPVGDDLIDLSAALRSGRGGGGVYEPASRSRGGWQLAAVIWSCLLPPSSASFTLRSAFHPLPGRRAPHMLSRILAPGARAQIGSSATRLRSAWLLTRYRLRISTGIATWIWLTTSDSSNVTLILIKTSPPGAMKRILIGMGTWIWPILLRSRRCLAATTDLVVKLARVGIRQGGPST